MEADCICCSHLCCQFCVRQHVSCPVQAASWVRVASRGPLGIQRPACAVVPHTCQLPAVRQPAQCRSTSLMFSFFPLSLPLCLCNFFMFLSLTLSLSTTLFIFICQGFASVLFIYLVWKNFFFLFFIHILDLKYMVIPASHALYEFHHSIQSC